MHITEISTYNIKVAERFEMKLKTELETVDFEIFVWTYIRNRDSAVFLEAGIEFVVEWMCALKTK